jgi:hypothetical protein
MHRLLCLAVILSVSTLACGRSEVYEPPRPRICWGTLSNRMAYLAGWMSAGRCGIIDNTEREVFGKRRGNTCVVPFDITGGKAGRFEFTFFPEVDEAQARYIHPGNVNDGVDNAWPCPKERFQ